jgi:hypothetical protein
MKTLACAIMFTNAALFFFGAVQHAGVAIGPLHEPLIVPAAIVEGLCGLSLVFGGAAVSIHRRAFRVAISANLFALAGVLLGVVALALGAGPRTRSNTIYHEIMLVLIAASLLFLRQTSKKTVSQVPQR